MRNLWLCMSIVPLAACTSGKTVTVGDLQPVMTLPATPNRDVDMLFVIDNSPSTADKQASLIASFPGMMDALDSLDGGRPNLHIGVVTSDMGTTSSGDPSPAPQIGSGPGQCAGAGDDGLLQHASPNLTGAFIADVANPDGTRTVNYTGELRDVFAQNAAVGSNGCGFEQHMAAMKRALTNPANDPFIRATANLAVVILADEDDCSMAHGELMSAATDMMGPLQSFRCTRFGLSCSDHGATSDAMNNIGPKGGCASSTDSLFVDDVQSYVDFLTGFKPEPEMVMVSAIAGDPTPVNIELREPPGGGNAIPALGHSCSYQAPDGLEVADPAVRIDQLTHAFPGRGSFQTVCQQDLTVSLSNIGYQARQLIGDPCLAVAIADTDASAPGIQPMCAVTEGTRDVPACDGMNLDYCWQLVDDGQRCASSPEHLRFEILRASPAPVSTYIHVRCLLP